MASIEVMRFGFVPSLGLVRNTSADRPQSFGYSDWINSAFPPPSDLIAHLMILPVVRSA
jgi:hypothetical protein